MTLFATILHFCWDLWLGWTIVTAFRCQRTMVETVTLTFLVGMYIETLLTGCLVFLSIPFHVAAITVLVSTVMICLARARRGGRQAGAISPTGKLQLWDWLVLCVLLEKLTFAIWQIADTPLYFDDAFTHWSGRARALYGEVNWSMDPLSPAFMGIRGSDHYPLGVSIWRATTALFNGHWNDVVARADCPIFFLISLFTVWAAVRRLAPQRWLAAGSAFILAALPLQVWHAASGHADIAVQAFAVASLAALLRSEFLFAGMLAAGSAWMKNDGLVIFIPALTLSATILARQAARDTAVKPWRCILHFFLGLATLVPWLVTKWIFKLGATPNNEGLAMHSGALMALTQKVMLGAAHGMFWPCLIVICLWGLPCLVRDRQGLAVLGCFLFIVAAIVFIFTATEAATFLYDDATIHRSLLQLYGIAVLLMAHSVAQRLRPP